MKNLLVLLLLITLINCSKEKPYPVIRHNVTFTQEETRQFESVLYAFDNAIMSQTNVDDVYEAYQIFSSGCAKSRMEI